MSEIKTVLYDLDGTLIDHFQAIYRCYCYAQEKLGITELASYEKVRATVGGSVPITMARLLGEDKAEAGTRYFREYFDQIMFEDLHLMPGVEWLLKSLYEKGVRQAVFTNKRGEPSRQIIDHLGLSKYLVTTIGTLDTPWKKPEPEFTQHVLEFVGADPATTILIGDSPFDLAAAAVGGFPGHLVATGSHSLEELRELDHPRAAGVYADLWELGGALFGLRP